MIWSSPDRVPTRGTVRDGSDADPWDWAELGMAATQAEPMDAEALEALRAEEMEQAYRRGRAEGEQAGQAKARRELEAALAATRRVLTQVKEAREGWVRVLEENLVALSTAVARQIVGRELSDDRETYLGLVQAAVAAYPMDQVLRIRIHPDDLALLADEETGEVPGDEATGGREARWIADEDIVRGGCVVEGPDRIVDGRVDAALERIFWGITHG